MDSKTAVRLITILVYFIHETMAQSCGGSSYVEPGKLYYVYSPNYPNAYRGGWTCSWFATCPLNYNCFMECHIELPKSDNCVLDRLLISRSGDPNFIGADVYCGTGDFTFVSTSNRISLALLSSQTTPGGRFLCQLSAQPAAPACSCGWRKSNRIVGGVETGMNEYPLMAQMVDKRINETKCGATIISNRYLLTAAHCLVGHQVNTFKIIVGSHNIRIGVTQTQELSCEWFKIHEQFNSRTYAYDIAVIRTRELINFRDSVGPACLPFKYATATFAGAQTTLLEENTRNIAKSVMLTLDKVRKLSRTEMMSWGTSFLGGPKPDVLQKVDVDVLSNSNCQQNLGTSTVVAPVQLCTFRLGKDSCQDDSGGPVIYTEPQSGLYFLIGIISFGQLCASRSPSVNTRLTSHLTWIQLNTPDANFCMK